MNNLASGLMLRAKYEQAFRWVEECLNITSKYRIEKKVSVFLDTYGCLLVSRGEVREGAEALKQALERSLMYGFDNETVCPPRCHLGSTARRTGEFDKALTEHSESLRVAKKLGEKYDEVVATVNIGADLLRVGNTEAAENYFAQGQDMSEKHVFLYPQTHVLFHRAWAAFMAKDEISTIDFITNALTNAKKYQHHHFIIQEGKISLPLFTIALQNEIEPEYVCWILKKIGEESLIAIEPVLNHQSPNIRRKIATLLRNLDSIGSLTLLRRMRYDKDETVKKMVKEYLAQLRKNVKSASDLLTSREIDVLRYVAKGETNLQIANKLFISERTVKTHVAKVFRKLGFTNRIEAAVFYHNLDKTKKSTTFND